MGGIAKTRPLVSACSGFSSAANRNSEWIRREPGVTCPRAIASLLFEVVEEAADELHVEVRERQKNVEVYLIKFVAADTLRQRIRGRFSELGNNLIQLQLLLEHRRLTASPLYIDCLSAWIPREVRGRGGRDLLWRVSCPARMSGYMKRGCRRSSP